MSDLAIEVRNISKVYRLGMLEDRPDTLAGSLAEMAKSPLRSFRNLRKLSSFSDIGEEGDGPADVLWALRDISFDVRRGEVLGIIGHNGAGKSTLLKVLSRVTEPSHGRIHLHGRVASLLEVGTGFHPELTGRENTYLNGAILGMTKAEVDQKFDEIVDFSGVERFIDTPVKRYSSGMRVRLAFAVAAHLDPEILIIDEVLAVGDASFQQRCLTKMEDVAHGGRTVLFVSHNMAAVAQLCSRSLLLEHGRITDEGTPNDVISRYLQGAGGGQGEPIRDIPHEEGVPAQITRLAVQDDDGQARLQFGLNEPVCVDLDFEVHEPQEDLVVACQVRAMTDEVVLVTTDADHALHVTGEGRSLCPRRAGRYRASFQLPAPLLNAGRYELSFVLFMPNRAVHHMVRRVFIDISDTDSFASAVYLKSRKGVIAVPMPWEVTPLNGGEMQVPVRVSRASTSASS